MQSLSQKYIFLSSINLKIFYNAYQNDNFNYANDDFFQSKRLYVSCQSPLFASDWLFYKIVLPWFEILDNIVLFICSLL